MAQYYKDENNTPYYIHDMDEFMKYNPEVTLVKISYEEHHKLETQRLGIHIGNSISEGRVPLNDGEMDFLKRLGEFFTWDYEKSEMNDREQIKEKFIEELKEL